MVAPSRLRCEEILRDILATFIIRYIQAQIETLRPKRPFDRANLVSD